MNKLIAITIGDFKGIGIHFILKEWKNKKIKNFIIITNYKIFLKLNLLNKNKINVIENESSLTKYNDNKLNLLNFNTKNQYTNAIDSIKIAYILTKKNKFKGILTLPLNKLDINKFVNNRFIDQTTFLSKLENNKFSNMVFIHRNHFFVPLSIHIELKKVFSFFKKKQLIINKIKSLIKTLEVDFALKKINIAIAGINPHAGEDGLISNDEKKYLIPIIKELRKEKINITGPISGDGLINKSNLKKFNVFLFTFHDQALIPFKIISNYSGINFTSNLNVIRVSPSHGTARNIIGDKSASSKGIINSFQIINKVYKNRKRFD